MKLSVILYIFLFSEFTFSQDFWHSISGPEGGSVTSILYDQFSSTIFAGTSNEGIYRSADNSNIWNQINSGLTNTDVKALAVDSNGNLIAGTFGGIFISTNNGDSWISANSGLTNPFVYCLAVSPNGNLFAGTGQRVFLSVNSGASWTPVFSGLPVTSITSLAINSTGDIFATSLGLGLYRSTNNGDLWIRKDTGIANPDIRSSTGTPNGFVFAGTFNGVYRSTNNGDIWIRKDSGISVAGPVYSFAFFSNGNIFLGKFSGGVFYSTDDGEYWTSVNSGLTSLNITSLTVNTQGYIFVATSNAGIFKSINTITNIQRPETNVSGFELSQNYPNPFNPVTKIKFLVPSNVKVQTSNVKIIIYDALGKEVETIINERLAPGSYEAEFNGSNLPSGIYFYKLEAGEFRQVRKMAMVK